MAGEPQRVIAYVKAEGFSKTIFSAGSSWPAQTKSLYDFLKDRALLLPGKVMAAIISQGRQSESARLFSDALTLACDAEFAAGVAKKATPNDVVNKAFDAAVEAREAIQDHLAAMLL